MPSGTRPKVIPDCTVAQDEAALYFVCVHILGSDRQQWIDGTCPLRAALINAGVTKFYRDLLTLRKEDILNLIVPEISIGGRVIEPTAPLPAATVNKVLAFVAYYHSLSRYHNEPTEVARILPNRFHEYLLGTWNKDAPIVPWQMPAPDETNAVSLFRKNIKISKTEYPILKDEANGQRWQEMFITVADHHGLLGTITVSHVPTNKALDEEQRKFMTIVFENTIKVPNLRSIVIEHTKDKDTRTCWNKIVNAIKKSITTDSRANDIANYLTSVKLKNITWRGTCVSFIAHWQEMLRQW